MVSTWANPEGNPPEAGSFEGAKLVKNNTIRFTHDVRGISATNLPSSDQYRKSEDLHVAVAYRKPILTEMRARDHAERPPLYVCSKQSILP